MSSPKKYGKKALKAMTPKTLSTSAIVVSNSNSNSDSDSDNSSPEPLRVPAVVVKPISGGLSKSLQEASRKAAEVVKAQLEALKLENARKNSTSSSSTTTVTATASAAPTSILDKGKGKEIVPEFVVEVIVDKEKEKEKGKEKEKEKERLNKDVAIVKNERKERKILKKAKKAAATKAKLELEGNTNKNSKTFQKGWEPVRKASPSAVKSVSPIKKQKKRPREASTSDDEQPQQSIASTSTSTSTSAIDQPSKSKKSKKNSIIRNPIINKNLQLTSGTPSRPNLSSNSTLTPFASTSTSTSTSTPSSKKRKAPTSTPSSSKSTPSTPSISTSSATATAISKSINSANSELQRQATIDRIVSALVASDPSLASKRILNPVASTSTSTASTSASTCASTSTAILTASSSSTETGIMNRPQSSYNGPDLLRFLSFSFLGMNQLIQSGSLVLSSPTSTSNPSTSSTPIVAPTTSSASKDKGKGKELLIDIGVNTTIDKAAKEANTRLLNQQNSEILELELKSHEMEIELTNLTTEKLKKMEDKRRKKERKLLGVAKRLKEEEEERVRVLEVARVKLLEVEAGLLAEKVRIQNLEIEKERLATEENRLKEAVLVQARKEAKKLLKAEKKAKKAIKKAKKLEKVIAKRQKSPVVVPIAVVVEEEEEEEDQEVAGSESESGEEVFEEAEDVSMAVIEVIGSESEEEQEEEEQEEEEAVIEVEEPVEEEIIESAEEEVEDVEMNSAVEDIEEDVEEDVEEEEEKEEEVIIEEVSPELIVSASPSPIPSPPSTSIASTSRLPRLSSPIQLDPIASTSKLTEPVEPAIDAEASTADEAEEEDQLIATPQVPHASTLAQTNPTITPRTNFKDSTPSSPEDAGELELSLFQHASPERSRTEIGSSMLTRLGGSQQARGFATSTFTPFRNSITITQSPVVTIGAEAKDNAADSSSSDEDDDEEEEEEEEEEEDDFNPPPPKAKKARTSIGASAFAAFGTPKATPKSSIRLSIQKSVTKPLVVDEMEIDDEEYDQLMTQPSQSVRADTILAEVEAEEAAELEREKEREMEIQKQKEESTSDTTSVEIEEGEIVGCNSQKKSKKRTSNGSIVTSPVKNEKKAVEVVEEVIPETLEDEEEEETDQLQSQSQRNGTPRFNPTSNLIPPTPEATSPTKNGKSITPITSPLPVGLIEFVESGPKQFHLPGFSPPESRVMIESSQLSIPEGGFTLSNIDGKTFSDAGETPLIPISDDEGGNLPEESQFVPLVKEPLFLPESDESQSQSNGNGNGGNYAVSMKNGLSSKITSMAPPSSSFTVEVEIPRNGLLSPPRLRQTRSATSRSPSPSTTSFLSSASQPILSISKPLTSTNARGTPRRELFSQPEPGSNAGSVTSNRRLASKLPGLDALGSSSSGRSLANRRSSSRIINSSQVTTSATPTKVLLKGRGRPIDDEDEEDSDEGPVVGKGKGKGAKLWE